jgi:hypothetical protein
MLKVGAELILFSTASEMLYEENAFLTRRNTNDNNKL